MFAEHDWPHTRRSLKRLKRAWLDYRTAWLTRRKWECERKLRQIQLDNLPDEEVYSWVEFAFRRR